MGEIGLERILYLEVSRNRFVITMLTLSVFYILHHKYKCYDMKSCPPYYLLFVQFVSKWLDYIVISLFTLHPRGDSTNRLQKGSSFGFKTFKPI